MSYELTDTQKEFLKGYYPKNKHFTDNEECFAIIKNLGLSGLTLKEMSECRNAVVSYYNEIMDKRDFDSMQPLMSVTAIIDHYSNGYTA